ncbi:MAG: outer membrane beta-barrel protein [Rikenellaceae bacterium]
MKKIYALLLALALATAPTMAQHYAEDFVISDKGANLHAGSNISMSYGVMSGITIPNFRIDHSGVETSGRTGFQAGFMWGIDFGILELIPEFWYETNKLKFNNESIIAGTEIKSNSIEIPVLFQLNLVDEFRLNMGPSFVLSNNSTATTTDGEEYEIGRIKSTTGFVLGVSYVAFGHLLMDVRYIGRFSSTTNDLNNGGKLVDMRAYSFSASIGYKF